MTIGDLTKRSDGQVFITEAVREAWKHGATVAEHALSERTRREYAAHWQAFEGWAVDNQLPSCPTQSAVVFAYLAVLHKRGLSVSTLQVVRAAIKHQHATLPPKAEGRDLDVATPEIKRLLRGARRIATAHGETTNKARPFLVSDWLDLARIVGTDLEAKRDLALIGLGLVRALRGPSELVALDYGFINSADARGALSFTDTGAVVRLRISKTKQDGEGEELSIEDGPVLAAVREWIALGRIAPGTAVFRAVRNQDVSPARIAARTLHSIIQRRAKQLMRWRGALMAEAEAMSLEYSTHSLRRGALTSMGKAGATVPELMDLGRHSPKSASVVLGYVDPEHVGARKMRKLGL